MVGEIILWVALALPLTLGLVFRVATTHIFFALMAGELLGRYFGHDIEQQAGPILERGFVSGYGEVILIILPMLVTAFFLRSSISNAKTLLHVLPLLITGLVCAAFILPALPEAVRGEISSIPLGTLILSLNRTIIGAMIVLQLVMLWLLNHKGAVRSKRVR